MNQKQITFKELGELYLESKRHNWSLGTMRIQGYCFRWICEYLNSKDIKYCSEFNFTFINKFIDYCKLRKELSNKTINKRLDLIRIIVDFGINERFIPVDFKFKYQKLKETVFIGNRIEHNDIKKIFTTIAIASNYDHFLTIRNRFIVLTLLETGVRQSELVKIKFCDFDIRNKILNLVKTKNNRHRKIYLSNTYIKAFTYYKKHMFDKFNNLNKDSFLFFTKRKKYCTICTIRYVLEKLQKQLDLNYSISSHKWRRTNATHLLQNCKDLLFVSKQLGHSSVDITRTYIIYDNEYQLQQKEKHSPIRLVEG